MKAQGEIYYTATSTYTGLCADASFARLLSAAAANKSGTTVVSAIGTAGTATTVICHVNATGGAWAVSAPLNTTPTKYFCADSSGYSGEQAAVLAINDDTCL
jgi:hypothetical protein